MDNIIIVSHCILNNHSKLKRYDSISRDMDVNNRLFIEFLLRENIGIIQLPCPESQCYGLNRWGHTKEQFDHPHYREECRDLFKPILNQIINYQNAGYNILAMVGVYGSPTCGVENTSIGDWGGGLSANPNLRKMISGAKKSEEAGIFIEEIQEKLRENKLDIPILEYNRKKLDRLKSQILKLKIEDNRILEIL